MSNSAKPYHRYLYCHQKLGECQRYVECLNQQVNRPSTEQGQKFLVYTGQCYVPPETTHAIRLSMSISELPAKTIKYRGSL